VWFGQHGEGVAAEVAVELGQGRRASSTVALVLLVWGSSGFFIVTPYL